MPGTGGIPVLPINTLVRTGAFDDFKRWLVAQATADVRVQAILPAWALGALLEGLVGFGYPRAVVAPILVGLGVVELDAIRVAALGRRSGPAGSRPSAGSSLRHPHRGRRDRCPDRRGRPACR
jgi:hypothetical protein